jgi:chromosome segregation ATPase
MWDILAETATTGTDHLDLQLDLLVPGLFAVVVALIGVLFVIRKNRAATDESAAAASAHAAAALTDALERETAERKEAHERATELALAVQQNAEALARLEASNSEKDDRIEDLNRKVDQLTSAVEDLTNKGAEEHAENVHLKARVKGQEQKIKELQAEVTALQCRVTALTTENQVLKKNDPHGGVRVPSEWENPQCPQ